MQYAWPMFKAIYGMSARIIHPVSVSTMTKVVLQQFCYISVDEFAAFLFVFNISHLYNLT